MTHELCRFPSRKYRGALRSPMMVSGKVTFLWGKDGGLSDCLSAFQEITGWLVKHYIPAVKYWFAVMARSPILGLLFVSKYSHCYLRKMQLVWLGNVCRVVSSPKLCKWAITIINSSMDPSVFSTEQIHCWFVWPWNLVILLCAISRL